MTDKPAWTVYDWEYMNPVTGKWDYARTPERAASLKARGIDLTAVYVPDVPVQAPNFIDEAALDKAAREGYAVRCKTNGPRVLAEYAAPYIMARQLDEARVIITAYLKALKP